MSIFIFGLATATAKKNGMFATTGLPISVDEMNERKSGTRNNFIEESESLM